ncbi:MAG: hypothetical protein LUD00_03405 [Prevotellaceae bacterium]|nr:hypothetical protein [Prevotellaceae bacterium]
MSLHNLRVHALLGVHRFWTIGVVILGCFQQTPYVYFVGCIQQTPPSLRATSPNLGEEPIYHSLKRL